MEKYKPPYEITSKMLDYVSKIMETIGSLNNYYDLEKMPIMRRNNKIKSIHSSLVIEGNSLTFEQVKDVINGKKVLGKEKDIIEVKNAYEAYELIKELNPYNVKDLLKTQGIITKSLTVDSGNFRKNSVGVFDKEVCIFMAPPHTSVPSLMDDLFNWLNANKDEIHPLILSSIFHYEFVFIHPFSDGNGRTARLWQNVILSNFKELFEYMPIESRIKKYQQEYYDSINICNKNGNSIIFVEFMLKMIYEELLELSNSNLSKTNNKFMLDLLNVLNYDIPMSANEIMEKLNIKSKETLRKNYIDPAIKEGLINSTLPDKPTSKNQMYYKL